MDRDVVGLREGGEERMASWMGLGWCALCATGEDQRWWCRRTSSLTATRLVHSPAGKHAPENVSTTFTRDPFPSFFTEGFLLVICSCFVLVIFLVMQTRTYDAHETCWH